MAIVQTLFRGLLTVIVLAGLYAIWMNTRPTPLGETLEFAALYAAQHALAIPVVELTAAATIIRGGSRLLNRFVSRWVAENPARSPLLMISPLAPAVADIALAQRDDSQARLG